MLGMGEMPFDGEDGDPWEWGGEGLKPVGFSEIGVPAFLSGWFGAAFFFWIFYGHWFWGGVALGLSILNGLAAYGAWLRAEWVWVSQWRSSWDGGEP